GDSIILVLPKIQVCQERTTCSGDGMTPSVIQRSVTAKCQSASSASGRTMNHGTDRRSFTPRPIRSRCSPDALLVLAELVRRLAGGLGQEIVGVMLADLARHVARDDAVVRQELGDALDRLKRQRGVEL